MVQRVPVWLAGASDPAAAPRTCLSRLDLTQLRPTAGETVVIVGDRAQAAAVSVLVLTEALREAGIVARVIAPPSAVQVLARLPARVRSPDWTDIDVGRDSPQLGRIGLPARLTKAGSLVVTSAIGDLAATTPMALGVLARYAHPHLALATRLGGNRHTLAVDVNLARRLDLILLTGQFGTLAVAVATTDLIAAELVGLALRQEQADPFADLPGPWEDPLVQRATELHLGVTIPDQVDLHPIAAEPTIAATLTALAHRLRRRLGIPAPP